MYTFITSWLILYQIMGLKYDWVEYDLFYSIARINCIVLYSLSGVVYYFDVLKTKMTLKERDFLKLFGFIIIMIILSKLIYPISYYWEGDFFITIYNYFSLELLIMIIASAILNFYFKDKCTRNLFLVNIIYYLMNAVIQIIFYKVEISSHFLYEVNYYITVLRDFGVIIAITFIVLEVHLYRKE